MQFNLISNINQFDLLINLQFENIMSNLSFVGSKPTEIFKLQYKNDLVPSVFVFGTNENKNDTLVNMHSNHSSKILLTKELPKISDEHNIEHRENVSENWSFFVILMLGVILLILAKELYRKAFKQLYESVISIKKYGLWQRDVSSMLNQLFYFTLPTYFISLPLVIKIVLEEKFNGVNGFNVEQYFAIFTGLLIFFFFRTIVITTASKIFNITDISKDYLSLNFITASVQAITLLPFLMFLIYSNIVIVSYIIIIIILGIELFRLIRLLISAFSKSYFNLFYIFLYFCTAEIIPILLILKVANVI